VSRPIAARQARRRTLAQPQPAPAAVSAPANALTPAERERVPAALNSAEFIDTTPVQVYATMFDRGMYLCSVSSMYRILAANAQAKGRRRLARQPARGRPRANHGRGSAPGTPGNVGGNPWSATSTADLVSTPRRHLT